MPRFLGALVSVVALGSAAALASVAAPISFATPAFADDAANADAAEARRVPRVVARDLDGKRFVLEDSLQPATVVTFWATWCKPCRKELPELQKLMKRYGKSGLRVIGVNGDGPVDQAKIRPYVRALGFDFTILPDPDGEIRRRFQVEVFPTTFLLDAEGRIRHRQVGYRQGDERVLEKEIRGLLGEDVEATGDEG